MTYGTQNRDSVAEDRQIRSGDNIVAPTAETGEDHREGPVQGAPPVSPTDGFAGVARLELDELLGQLIARATDVQSTQGRLRGLLRANMEVARAVDLEELLSHVLEAARTLVGARYSALGVVEDGQLVRFLHVGMDAATVTAVGIRPEGKGLLGRLIDYPQPLRLREIAEHVSSIGFPANHPPMRSFLGVPIRIGSRVFGNLYLADKQGAAEFSSDDEELATALAAAAGVAIDNAALLDESRRRQRWQTAMMSLSTAVLGSDDPAAFALPQIVIHAMTASSAAGVFVCVPADDPNLLLIAAGGGVYNDRIGTTVPIAGSIYGDALTGLRPFVVLDPAADPPTAGQDGDDAAPIAALPMHSQAAVTGVLAVCRRPGGPTFDRLDLELLGSYASHAALVLQLAQARHDNAQLLLVNDRQQIAEDLHHHVIHRLYRLGMDLHGIASRPHGSATEAALLNKIDDTDEIIHELRAAIFALHPVGAAPPEDLAGLGDGGVGHDGS
jgi:GAF domain-containing protein